MSCQSARCFSQFCQHCEFSSKKEPSQKESFGLRKCFIMFPCCNLPSRQRLCVVETEETSYLGQDFPVLSCHVTTQSRSGGGGAAPLSCEGVRARLDSCHTHSCLTHCSLLSILAQVQDIEASVLSAADLPVKLWTCCSLENADTLVHRPTKEFIRTQNLSFHRRVIARRGQGVINLCGGNF